MYQMKTCENKDEVLHSNLTCFFPIKYTCIQQTGLVFDFRIYFTDQLLEKLDNIIAYFHDWPHFILLFLQKNTNLYCFGQIEIL
jgi:hypothetical protein